MYIQNVQQDALEYRDSKIVSVVKQINTVINKLVLLILRDKNNYCCYVCVCAQINKYNLMSPFLLFVCIWLQGWHFVVDNQLQDLSWRDT